MASTTNIITAAFQSGARAAKTAKKFQWDYGQVLVITGLDGLPDAFEAHFSNKLGGGWTTSQIGTTDEEGVGSVTIPDRYFESGEPIICYIYLHSGELDGETVYTITIPIVPRGVPLNEAVTHEEQGVIQQYMAALTAAADKAEQEADSAEGSAGNAAQSAADAQADALAAAQDAAEAKRQADAAALSAQAADQSAGAAHNDAQAADASAEDAEAWAVGERGGQAVPATDETYQNNAKHYAGQASGSASAAHSDALDAAASAAAALAQAQAAAQSAAQALAQAQAAANAKTAAETAQGLAEDAAQDAADEAARVEGLLDTKGDALAYDPATGALDLMSGQDVLSTVTIEAGGTYSLTYDPATGRLSLLEDGTEISFVILSGLPVTITQEGDVLHVNNVPAISIITQDGDVLALT